MRCRRCTGLLIQTQIETPEGALRVIKCFNCGFASDRVMVQHRTHRPEPFKTVPITKAKRPSFPPS